MGDDVEKIRSDDSGSYSTLEYSLADKLYTAERERGEALDLMPRCAYENCGQVVLWCCDEHLLEQIDIEWLRETLNRRDALEANDE